MDRDPERTHPPDSLPPARVLVGVTAAGKTALALELARHAPVEVVSMDSMLVYRGMDVGTAKPTAAERARVRHHVVDRVAPSERYDVTAWLRDARAAEEEVRARGGVPLLVGGTGFYLQALLHGIFAGPPASRTVRAALEERARSEGLPALHAELERVDPRAAERIHPNDGKRVVRALEVWEATGRALSDWQEQWGWGEEQARPRALRAVGLAPAADELERRFRARTRAMLEGGWPEEVARILGDGGFGPTAIQALGYREVIALVEGRLDRAAVEERIVLRTRQFARRQRTWFRRFPAIPWLDPGAPDLVGRTLELLGI